MNYNTLMNKPTINNKELIGNNKASDIGGLSEEEMEQLLTTDLTPYYTKAQIDDLFSRSYVYREKSGSIVTFNCPASVNGIDKVVAKIVAVQSGTGDPSPTNVRPISGWSAVNVYVGPTTDPQDATVYTIDLDGTRYGGTLDVVSGVLTVDRVNLLLNGLTYTKQSRATSIGGSYFRAVISQKAISDTDATQLYSHGVSNNPYASKTNCARTFESSTFIFVGFEDEMGIDTLEKFNQWLADNPTASICYKIKEPQTYQLTPTMVKSLLGTNNLWADSGDITVKALDKIIQE